MKEVRISALGQLRNKLPEEQLFAAADEAETLGELVDRCTGIPESEVRLCYVVNETIQKANYVPGDGDQIVLLKMGGAG